MELNEMLQHVVNNKCSDLHLVTNLPPMVRLDGELNHIPGQTKVDAESMKKMIFSIMSDEQKELFLARRRNQGNICPSTVSMKRKEAECRSNAFLFF